MAKDRRRAINYISAALLALVLVSILRQSNLSFAGSEVLIPAIVLAVYLVLIFIWISGTRRRIEQAAMKTYLISEGIVMIFWVTVRFIQDAFLAYMPRALHVSGYIIVFPLVLLPLLGFYCSLCLGRGLIYRPGKRIYLLFIPAVILICMMLTNEMHHIVFRLLPGESADTEYFHPWIGIFIIIIWAICLELVRLMTIYRICRRLQRSSVLKLLPFIPFMCMVVFPVPYIIHSFVVSWEIIEFTAMIFYLEAAAWEFCIISGMVPVNTGYREIFSRSTIAIQLLDPDGNQIVSSAHAETLTEEAYARLKAENTFLTQDNIRLQHNKSARWDIVWEHDMSDLVRINNELALAASELENESSLRAEEIRVKADETRIQAQMQIYDNISNDVAEQIKLINSMLVKLEHMADPKPFLRRICVVGTFIKRYCNLQIIKSSECDISAEEMSLAFNEYSEALALADIKLELETQTVSVSSENVLKGFKAIESYIERNRFTPCRLLLSFTDDGCMLREVKFETKR